MRLGAVGDVVRTLPAASALRQGYPDAHLAWLVEPPSASLLRGLPWLDEVCEFPRPALRDALAPRRQSRFRRNDALVRYLGLAAEPLARPLAVTDAALAAARKALGEGPAPVAIHPGTSDSTAHKRWTAEGYGALARALAADGVPSVVTAGPARDDRAFAEAVVAASDGAARMAPPTPSLLDLAALFQVCRLYVGGDTGPLHVASLVGTPVVQLIGPTHPVENEPFAGTASRTVRVDVACNPCRRGCAAASCMRAIHPDLVIDAARGLLAAQAGNR